MIVAGIGCRSGERAENIIDALLQATHLHGVALTDISALASGEIKAHEPAIRQVADSLDIPLIIVSTARMKAVSGRTISHSEQSIRHTGLPSLSEAAALAAAGDSLQLAGPRIVHCGVTVALAISQVRKPETAGPATLKTMRCDGQPSCPSDSGDD